ncbi:hypothetical protein [Dyadobacter sandarakinus]|uniref:Uncharacterized protein n=1 Tax=Dyadobacter sandarakinus TaxID=2747268 RepID=A0ABX7I7V4_9BACT|nr:hypothetical protein [Dyadobacter sandarakinus]QRR02169.1 hypothetical protein HWI92_15275 [Dyadobacter sandarakinus]
MLKRKKTLAAALFPALLLPSCKDAENPSRPGTRPAKRHPDIKAGSCIYGQVPEMRGAVAGSTAEGNWYKA